MEKSLKKSVTQAQRILPPTLVEEMSLEANLVEPRYVETGWFPTPNIFVLLQLLWHQGSVA